MNQKRPDPIAESLELVPIVYEDPETIDAKSIDDDFEFTRTNLINIIQVGGDALENLADIAKQSESPRAYEVLANQINTLVSANKELLDLRKKKEEIKSKMTQKSDSSNHVTNNNLFVGSPTELLEMLKNNSNDQ